MYNFITKAEFTCSNSFMLKDSIGSAYPLLNFDNKLVRNFALKKGIVIPRFYFN